MDKRIKKKISKFNKIHKHKIAWRRVISSLGIFVFFWTVYALILPAITLDTTDYENLEMTPGIQSLEPSGEEIVYAEVIKYDDLRSYVSTPQQFIIFAKSGKKYYAFGSNGEAIPINITGNLQDGATIKYISEDVSEILWLFESYFDTEVSANFDISIQSVKNGDYFWGSSNGFFYNSDDKRPGFYDIEGKIAQGANLDPEIAVGLWTWNSFEEERILQLKNGQFLNTQIIGNPDICNGEVTEIHDNMYFDDSCVVYCAIVHSVVKDKQNLVGQVIAREDVWDSAAQGNKYILFTQVGDKYYALNGDGTASEVKLKSALGEGAIVYYSENDVDNISWYFDNRYDQNDVNANIDVSIKNVETGQYLYSTRNGNMFVNVNDGRPRTICSFFTNNRW